MAASAEVLATARLSSTTARGVFRAALDALAQPGRAYRLPPSAAGDLPPALLPALALADIELRVAVVGTDADLWGEVLAAVTGASIVEPPAADWLVALDGSGAGAHAIAAVPAGSALAPEAGARVTVGCERIVPFEALDAAPCVDGASGADASDDGDVGTEDFGDASDVLVTLDSTDGSGHSPLRKPEARVTRSPFGTGSDQKRGEMSERTQRSWTEVAVTGPGVPSGMARSLRLIGVAPEVVAAMAARNTEYPAGVDVWCCADDGALVGLPRSAGVQILCAGAERGGR